MADKAIDPRAIKAAQHLRRCFAGGWPTAGDNLAARIIEEDTNLKAMRAALKLAENCEYEGGGLCDGCRRAIDDALGKGD